MESQLHRTHGHHYEQQPYNSAAHQTVTQGHEDEEHHEKISVLGKVKAKAKKLKSKLTSHGHGHHHEHEHDDEEEEEDYYSDEEMEQDPEVHGAPIYDSASVTAPRGTPTAGLNLEGNLENPSLGKEDRYESKYSEVPVRPFGQWDKESDLVSDTTAEAVSGPGDKHVPFRNAGGREGNMPYSTGNVGGREGAFTHTIGNAGGREGNLPFSTENFGEQRGTLAHDPIGKLGGQKETFMHHPIGNLQAPRESFTHDPIGNLGEQGGTFAHDPIKNLGGRREDFTYDPIANVGVGTGNLGDSVVRIGDRSMGMEEDPHTLPNEPSNYQSKVADPTGRGEEIGITPIISSLDKMGIYDETRQKPRPETVQNIYSTGSRNQFSPDSMPAESYPHDHSQSSENPTLETKQTILGIGSHNQFSHESTPSESLLHDHNRSSVNPQSTSTGMVSSAASSLANKAVSAKNAVASTMGYGGAETERSSNESTNRPTALHKEGIDHHNQLSENPQSTYTGMVSSAASSLANKATSAKNAVASAMGYGGVETERSCSESDKRPTALHEEGIDHHNRLSENPQSTYTGMASSAASSLANKAASAKNAVASTLGYGGGDTERLSSESDKRPTALHEEGIDHHIRLSENPQGTYTGMASSAASALANKAISAKNAVASTLGYGGGDAEKSTSELDKRPTAMYEGGTDDRTKSPAGGGATDYAHKIASTVTDKLAPIYEKVSGAGSTVMSKVVQTDKGGVSMKEYWTEKLRPGEEDKALSDVISGAYKTKIGTTGGANQREVGKLVSDALYKQEPDENEGDKKIRRETVIVGKVTQLKPVAEPLDTSGHSDGGVGAGKGVVDIIKGTVGSWIGKGKGTESHTPPGGEAVHEHGQYDTGETTRRDLDY